MPDARKPQPRPVEKPVVRPLTDADGDVWIGMRRTLHGAGPARTEVLTEQGWVEE